MQNYNFLQKIPTISNFIGLYVDFFNNWEGRRFPTCFQKDYRTGKLKEGKRKEKKGGYVKMIVAFILTHPLHYYLCRTDIMPDGN